MGRNAAGWFCPPFSVLERAQQVQRAGEPEASAQECLGVLELSVSGCGSSNMDVVEGLVYTGSWLEGVSGWEINIRFHS